MTERVLVDGATFLATDAQFRTGGRGGLFHRDTRYLSRLSVSIDGTELTPVGDHLVAPWRRVVTSADVSSEINEIDGSEQKHTRFATRRDQVVAENMGLVERVTVTNHTADRTTVPVSIDVGADFADLFEVRDLQTDIDRAVECAVDDASIQYRYVGSSVTDGDETLLVGVHPRPDEITVDGATFEVTLDPQASTDLTLAALPNAGETGVGPSLFERACERAGGPDLPLGAVDVGSTARYGTLFEHARRDLRALVTETAHGPVALAGVPWFATVFGRDALLTAYNVLHFSPKLAKGTLRYLAAHQGSDTDSYREEEPGKILHEMRNGELAKRGHIPHDPYFGTIDATPLWLIVLSETHRWTGDDAFVDDLWDAADAAVSWLNRSIDRVGDDPFLYYVSSEEGLAHKAWRDTQRSVQFSDGTPAEPPLASVEVQGYVYDAFRRVASLARERGAESTAGECERRAERIRDRFDEEFWLSGRGYYGAAKNANGRVVDSITSNVGQCLWSGIVPEKRAGAVVETLLDDGLYSGWGVRTMSSEDAGFSPVSYHVGGVWPHDNALIALGTNEYGFRDATERIASDVLDACRTLEDQRVPELYCGFASDRPPCPYPSACKPQAWGASTPFSLLRALFDVHPDSDADGYAAFGAVPESVEIDVGTLQSLAGRSLAEKTADVREGSTELP